MKTLCVLCLFCALCVSCEYKDLCYDHNHVVPLQVIFDWTKAPEAQVKGMTVQYYNMNNLAADPVRYDYPGMDGGTARLGEATWQALAYNYDTETILYRDMQSPATLEAYTRQSSIEEGTQLSRSGMPRAVEAADEPVILEPDPLWAAVSDDIVLELGKTHEPVVMQPTRRVHELTVHIVNVPNLEYAGQFGAAVSGLAPSVKMATGELGEGCATQSFPLSVVGDTLTATVHIFGHCPHLKEGQVNPHLLTVYAILADGSKWYHTVDISDEVHNTGAPDPGPAPEDDGDIVVDLDGLPVPKPIVNGSGFRPTIDGWQGVEIDVSM